MNQKPEQSSAARPEDDFIEDDAGASLEAVNDADRGEPAAGTSAVDRDALVAEHRSLQDRHLRLAAEYDNYRKRSDRERAELWGRAQGDLAKRLLDVLDDLQRYASADESMSAASLVEGARLVEKKMRHALESAGLEPIAAEEEFFDPATMEALMTVPTETREEDDQVAAVFQKGYRFKDVLIRPARVQVKKYE